MQCTVVLRDSYTQYDILPTFHCVYTSAQRHWDIALLNNSYNHILCIFDVVLTTQGLGFCVINSPGLKDNHVSPSNSASYYVEEYLFW